MIWFLFLCDEPRTPDCMWFQPGRGLGQDGRQASAAWPTQRPGLLQPELWAGWAGRTLSSSPSFITKCVERRLEPPFSG